MTVPRHSAWWYVRVALYAAGFVGGVLTGQALPADIFAGMPVFVMVFMGIGNLVFIPVATVFSIDFQARNPFSAKVWSRPSHETNPLNLFNPLSSIHFFVFYLLATAAGLVVVSPWAGLHVAVFGVLIAACAGIEMLALRYSMKRHAGRIRDVSAADAPAAPEVDRSGASKDSQFRLWRAMAIVSGLMALVGTGRLVETALYLADARRTTGRVIRMEARESDGTTVHAPVFEYQDGEGTTRQARSGLASTPPRYAVGDSVALLYDAASPWDAREADPFTLWFGGTLTLLFGGIPLAFFLWQLSKVRRQEAGLGS